MPTFRKKPVCVQAFLFTGEPIEGVRLMVSPEKAGKFAVMYGVISTLEGEMIANIGDWIITGAKGEKYPIKDAIFQETYEPA